MKDLQTLDTQTPIVAAPSVREMKEVEAAVILAKKFPRDTLSCIQRIKESCKRKRLAKKAMYSYPRGGTQVIGPSIRLAEVMAQAWGNLNFGVREISSEHGESLVEAYCWDYDTNVRQSKTFIVPHIRYSKKKGNSKLTDPRDIYEMVANQGARRLRACILGIIPLDIVEEATDECMKTLKNCNKEPIQDRISKMLSAFTEHFQINQSMLEKRLAHNLSETSEIEMVTLITIFNSLRDGMSKRGDWFEFKESEPSVNSDKLNKLGKTKEPEKKTVESKPEAPEVSLEVVINKEEPKEPEKTKRKKSKQDQALSDMHKLIK